MQPGATHTTTMVELWSRKSAPESADLQRALHIARRCTDEADSPLWMRSLAWQLVRDSHEAVGWEIPKTDKLSQCRAAAASVRHACSLLHEEMISQIDNVDGPILVLGALGAGRSLFDRWDAIPSIGAVLVPFDRDDDSLPSASDFNTHRGVMWAGAGRHAARLRSLGTAAEIGGREVLVPGPEIIMARTHVRDIDPASLGALVFTAAAHQAATTGIWSRAESTARAMEAELSPTEFAIRLGIDRWLDLKVSKGKRLALAVKRVFRRSAA
jgi:hypothetical protein